MRAGRFAVVPRAESRRRDAAGTQTERLRAGAVGAGAVDANQDRVVDHLEPLEKLAVLLDLREQPPLLVLA